MAPPGELAPQTQGERIFAGGEIPGTRSVTGGAPKFRVAPSPQAQGERIFAGGEIPGTRSISGKPRKFRVAPQRACCKTPISRHCETAKRSWQSVSPNSSLYAPSCRTSAYPGPDNQDAKSSIAVVWPVTAQSSVLPVTMLNRGEV